MPKLGENRKISKSRMRRKSERKIQDIRVFEKSEFQPSHCFFKVQCKMNSDASNHELKIDDKESIRCHILKCFEI